MVMGWSIALECRQRVSKDLSSGVSLPAIVDPQCWRGYELSGTLELVNDAGGDAPVRGRVEIEWLDGRSGWALEPRMTWSMAADPPLDPKRAVLLFASLLDAAEREAERVREEE